MNNTQESTTSATTLEIPPQNNTGSKSPTLRPRRACVKPMPTDSSTSSEDHELSESSDEFDGEEEEEEEDSDEETNNTVDGKRAREEGDELESPSKLQCVTPSSPEYDYQPSSPRPQSPGARSEPPSPVGEETD